MTSQLTVAEARKVRWWVTTFVAVVSGYIACQMLSDVASLRIIYLLGFSIDAGTLIYPLTFTLRDLVHKTAGIRAARVAIFAAAVINLFMAWLFWLVAKLPPDMHVGEQRTFGQLLAPVWRIVFASILAEVIYELVDGEVYQRFVNRWKHRYQWGRVLTSNSVSVPLDSAVFVSVAFLGVYSFSTCVSIFWANILLKGACTLISIPLIYSVHPLVKADEDIQ
jgi:uncharacterized integral membrane protein (TIGR00697 family)